MPELPEVETIRRILEKKIKGEKIRDVEILSKKQFPGDPEKVVNASIKSIERRGKNLILRLDNGLSVWIHLKLNGQLIWVKDFNKHPEPATRVVLVFLKGKLFFNELRKFGWMKVAENEELEKEFLKLGPEPLSREFSFNYLKNLFRKKGKPIKLVLLDQENIAGIGNIYANEALFEAGIHPQKPAKELSEGQIEKLRQAIISVLKEGLRFGGSSSKDESYRKPDGSSGSYQNRLRVYQKDGQKCSRCQTVIKRINVGGRGTFICEKCQKR